MSDGNKAEPPHVECRIIKMDNQDLEVPNMDPIRKSDKTEQISETEAYSATDWITQIISQRGLKALVSHSTILPQCIRAYKNNIAGFGIAVKYMDDYEEETEEMKQEFSAMERIIELLNFDRDTKEVFEDVVESRETYGIAYIECIRNLEGDVVEIEFVKDTPTIELTRPMEPYVDITYFYKGEPIPRKKKFKKYRQTVGGKTVYFKEYGDPRIMDKRSGKYLLDGESLELDYQANEIMEFTIGTEPYGEVRWIGQTLSVDGTRKAENLNNNYFTNGRHTPLMIIVKGGTLSDDSFAKLKGYMNGIRGEAGQHAFLVLETEDTETRAGFADVKQPEIEIKDMAAILQKDELFQEYQENSRRKAQSSFQLPDLYVAYTTDFNRATAQTAMEVTEKQVFQPERASLAWQINNKLLNGYGFKYCQCYFEAPDITNPDDMAKILNITERAGGMTPNIAKELTYNTLGKDAENYPDEWGDIPLQYTKSQPQPALATQGPEVMDQLEQQIAKAAATHDDSIVAIMKEVRRLILKQQREAE